MIILTRARAASADSLMLAATLAGAEIYTPDALVYQYEHGGAPGEQWFSDHFSLSVQDIAVVDDAAISPARPRGYALLSAEGDVYYLSRPDRVQEVIPGAGTTNPGSKFYGKVFKLRQIGQSLYVCGAGGQIYKRYGRDDWRLLTDAVLFDPDAQQRQDKIAAENGHPEPEFLSPEWQEWVTQRALNPASRNVFFNDIQGLSEDAIYICGETGPGTKPVLCYWDGQILQELKLPVAEAALTGICIENRDSVWICGREGVILHGSWARGFNPVNAPTRNNLFHGFTPYRGKLVMAASVRPGGLYELDPETGAFGRFRPALPPLTQPSAGSDAPNAGPFFAQAIGDVLWVVGLRDIFRFDGTEWQRIKHPDMA
ncbi:hypothetical protein [Paracoccus pacificus]|uniref:TIGR03032 family protein n=1 Tax=Paracoccus pacificus TaxID=1463598 RepID=A0ABW4R8Q9_9RHOB